ncbi:MAG TPA: hypothetical protein VM389_05205 [Phycisphaerae bacterium]|nr:hypothetical protein [Phycisphaerae bacterium]
MRGLCAISCVFAAGAILAIAPASEAQTNDGTVKVRVGTVGMTKAYVSENHVRQRMGPETARGVKVATMGEAAIYRALTEGKLDLGSVLAWPQDVGIKDFDAAFSAPPRTMKLGHLAVSACVSAKRTLPRLTVEQVGRIVSGEIADWRQLGAGEGGISVMTDERAIHLVTALTGAKPAGNLRGGKGSGTFSVDD